MSRGIREERRAGVLRRIWRRFERALAVAPSPSEYVAVRPAEPVGELCPDGRFRDLPLSDADYDRRIRASGLALACDRLWPPMAAGPIDPGSPLDPMQN